MNDRALFTSLDGNLSGCPAKTTYTKCHGSTYVSATFINRPESDRGNLAKGRIVAVAQSLYFTMGQHIGPNLLKVGDVEIGPCFFLF